MKHLVASINLKYVKIFSLFFLSFSAFILWRSFPYLVWDDTSSSSYNMYVNHGHFSIDNISLIISESFSYIQPDGYRPISAFIRGLGDAIVYSYGIKMSVFLLFDGIIIGLSFVLFFFFSKNFLSTTYGPYFSSFLFFLSTPVLTSSLILFSGIQLLSVSAILSILLVYKNCDIRNKSTSQLLFFALLLVGPWVREVVLLAPALVVLSEALSRRGLRRIGVLAGLGLLHALFPTALISLFIPTLPIQSVFQMGNVGAQIAVPMRGGLLARLGDLHWRIFGDIFSIMPPTLTAIGLGGTVLFLARCRDRSSREFRDTLLMSLFFGAALIPFLKLFNEQVHLTYALIPLSVLIVRQIEKLDVMVSRQSGRIPAMALGVVLALTTLDQATNALTVRQTTATIYTPVLECARWLRRSVPAGTIVISNAHLLEDVRFYTKGWIAPWDSVGGTPDRTRWVLTRDAVQRLLADRGDHPAYFLDVRAPGGRGQRDNKRALSYVRDRDIAMQNGPRFRARYFYPIFDPLRLLLPTIVSTWPGPPDLEFDFYRGPARSGGPLVREVAADFDLYRITGDYLARGTPNPILLVEGFHGFNLIRFRGVVYAILQSDGPFDIRRVKSGGYSRIYQGDNVSTVEAEVLKGLATTPSSD